MYIVLSVLKPSFHGARNIQLDYVLLSIIMNACAKSHRDDSSINAQILQRKVNCDKSIPCCDNFMFVVKKVCLFKMSSFK